MNLRQHYNIKEMVVDGIDLFNKRLKELKAVWLLKDDPDVIKDNYNMMLLKDYLREAIKEAGFSHAEISILSFHNRVSK